MPRGPDVGALRPGDGEADRMPDFTRRDFFIANESREDRQPGGVRRCPGCGTQGMRCQFEDRSGIRLPARRLREGAVQLVKDAVASIDCDRMTITVAGRST